MKKRVRALLQGCKMSLGETIKLDDERETGVVTIDNLREAFETLDLDVPRDVLDFILFIVFRRSESTKRMQYEALLELLDESEHDSPIEDEEEEEVVYEEDEKQAASEDNTTVKPSTEPRVQEHSPRSPKEDEELSPEEEELLHKKMIEVAEGCFVRIGERLQASNTTVSRHWGEFVAKELVEMSDGSREDLELLSPHGFLLGLKTLGLAELSEEEVECVMMVLAKEELDNNIIVEDLVLIMENFGVYEQDAVEETPTVPPEASSPERKKTVSLEGLPVESVRTLVRLRRFLEKYRVLLKDLVASHAYD